ncbi:MAG: LamG-like jellyroll fold domain-containing protein [Phycisphaerae bacterium]
MKRNLLVLSILTVCGSLLAAYPATNPAFWLDATALTGFSDGDTVSTWPDISGGGNDAVSPGDPTYRADALNGRPVIEIAGSSDTDGYGLNSQSDYFGFNEITNVKTLAFVFKPTSNTYWSWSSILNSPTGNQWHGDTSWGNTYWDHSWALSSILNSDLAIDGKGGYDGGWTSLDYNNYHVITVQMPDSTDLFDCGWLAHSAREGIDAANTFGMYISELILYTTKLSDEELKQLQLELGVKYGLYAATDFSPANGASNIYTTSTLSWTPADESWPADVYCSTSSDDVANGAEGAKIVSQQAVSSTSPALDFATTYYWKVDMYEPNSIGTGYVVVPGTVNSFTTVMGAPIITDQPDSVVAEAGAEVNVSVAGDYIESFQWYLNDNPIPGATDETYTIASLDITDEGIYHCEVANNSDPNSVASERVFVLSKRLVGWYKLDGDWTDSVDEAVQGAPAFDGVEQPAEKFVAGKVGSGYSFVQADGIIEIPNTADYYNFYSAGGTINTWFYTEVDRWNGIFGKSNNDSSAGLLFELAGSWTFMGLRDKGLASPWAELGQWHMATLTIDTENGTMTRFIDGRQDGDSSSFSGPIAWTDVNLYFGGEKLDNSWSFEGIIDDVRFYSYPMTPMEVAGLYTEVETEAVICVGNPTYDLNDDCMVDMADLAALATQWLDCNLAPTCTN